MDRISILKIMGAILDRGIAGCQSKKNGFENTSCFFRTDDMNLEMKVVGFKDLLQTSTKWEEWDEML